MAAWTVVVGSVVVVLGGFDTMSTLHTLETRTAIEKMLAEPPMSGMGLGVSGVQRIIHVATLVASGCATAAAVLGYHALRRSRPARVLLSVLAVPMMVASLATGALFSGLVVSAATAMLWLSPAREWFAGTWRPADLGSTRARGPQAPPAFGPPPSQPPAPQPPPGWRPPPAWQPPPGPRPVQGYGAPAAWVPPAPLQAGPVRRPAGLVVACVLTWVFAGFSLLMAMASLALLTIDRDLLLTEMHRQNPELASQGISDDLVVTASFFIGGVLVAWCVAALVIAGFAFAGRAWARVALFACSAGAVLLLLLSVLTGQLLLLLPLVAATATSANLMRADVRAWFARTAPRGAVGPRGGMRP